MNKQEILEKAQSKKVIIGEMEMAKLNKANWIAVVSAFILAVGFIIALCCLGQKASAFAIAAICFCWASIFYFCQYFIAKRPWQVLIGAILEAIGSLIMITNFILANIGVI